MQKAEIWRALEQAYGEISPLLPKETAFDKNLHLLGEDGVFDSIAIVAFSSAIEDSIAQKTGKEIHIVSDLAFSRQQSPFKSMHDLATYIAELLADSKTDDLL